MAISGDRNHPDLAALNTTFSLDDGIGYYGPAEGFELTPVTLTFTLKFNTPDTYNYKIYALQVQGPVF